MIQIKIASPNENYICRCEYCGRFVSPTGKDGTRYDQRRGLICKKCDEEIPFGCYQIKDGWVCI